MCLSQGAWSQIWSRVGGCARLMSVPCEANSEDQGGWWARSALHGPKAWECLVHGVYTGQRKPPGS